MDNLILVPHQDDEMIGCYYLMKLLMNNVTVTTVFKGGGQPKDKVLDEDKLYDLRCNETKKACRKLGVTVFDFLGIPRGTNYEEIEYLVNEYLEVTEPNNIYTTFPHDNHEEHMILGQIVRQLVKKWQKAFGFIVQTDYLNGKINVAVPDIQFKLSEENLKERYNLICEYKTQSHFLPNVIRRPEYKYERYWRITK